MLKNLGENFVLKVISLAASVTIWLYVASERNPVLTKLVNAEVRLVGVQPADLIVRVTTESVPVEISGPRSEVLSVADGDVKAVVNQSAAHPGDRQIRITRFDRPSEAPNVTLRPSRLNVAADVIRKQRKKMRIIASFNNEPPFGRVYDQPKLNPVYATAIGAKDELQRVARLAVFAETRGANIRASVDILPLDADGVLVENIEIEPPATSVELRLVEAPASRTLPVSVNYRGRPAAPYVVADISVEPGQVAVSGKSDQVLQLTNIAAADVSIDGITADVTREVPLVLPDGVSLKGGSPTVRVTVKVRKPGSEPGTPP